MSRPRKPAKQIQGGKRITVAPFTELGYACLVNGYWKTRVRGGSLITTKVTLADGKAGEDRVKAILAERIQAALNGHAAPPLVPLPSTPAIGAVRTIADLSLEYIETALEHEESDRTRLTERGEKQAAVLRAARRHYFPKPLQDTPLDVATIEQLIREKERTSPLASGTRQGYMIALRKMFRYAVRYKYLTDNPIHEDDIPANTARQIGRFTREEIDAMLAYCQNGPRAPWDWREVALAIRLQSLIGARAEEMLSIPRDRVTDHEFWIRGKGAKWRRFTMVILPELMTAARRKNGKLERLRLAWLEEIRATMTELMAREAPKSGRLFHLTYKQYSTAIEEAQTGKRPHARHRTGTSRRRGWRGTHSLRKFAIWYWTEVLRLPERVEKELAAHTREVAMRHYIERRTPEEQARAILLDKD